MAWDSLRVFMVLVEAGSVAAAARRFKISQSTIWRRVSALEKSLNVTLFERSDSGYILTERGAQLRERLAGVRRQVDIALRNLSRAGDENAGTVRVVVPNMLGSIIAKRYLDARRNNARLTLELIASDPLTIARHRDAEVVVTSAEQHAPGFVLEGCFGIEYGLFASEPYLRQAGVPKSTADLKSHDIVDFDTSILHSAPAWWLNARRMAGGCSLRTNCPFIGMSAAEAGLGLALLPTSLPGRETNLVRVLPDSKIEHLKVHMFVEASLQREKRVISVRDFTESVLARMTSQADRAHH